MLRPEQLLSAASSVPPASFCMQSCIVCEVALANCAHEDRQACTGHNSAADVETRLANCSVLGDAIHFVLCGLQNCKLSDVICQDMQRGSSQEQGPAAAVSVTLTFELPAADQGPAGQTPRHISFSRSHAPKAPRGTLTVRDAHGQTQQLSEVGECQCGAVGHSTFGAPCCSIPMTLSSCPHHLSVCCCAGAVQTTAAGHQY
jgi:hypothetical protein